MLDVDSMSFYSPNVSRNCRVEIPVDSMIFGDKGFDNVSSFVSMKKPFCYAFHEKLKLL